MCIYIYIHIHLDRFSHALIAAAYVMASAGTPRRRVSESSSRATSHSPAGSQALIAAL